MMTNSAVLLITALAAVLSFSSCNARRGRALKATEDDLVCVNTAWAVLRERRDSLTPDAWKKALRSLRGHRAVGTHSRAVVAATDVLGAITACNNFTDLVCTTVRILWNSRDFRVCFCMTISRPSKSVSGVEGGKFTTLSAG